MRLFAIYPEVLADRKTAEVMAHAMIWTEDADVAGAIADGETALTGIEHHAYLVEQPSGLHLRDCGQFYVKVDKGDDNAEKRAAFHLRAAARAAIAKATD